MTKTLLTLVLLVALPAAAQVPFDQLPEQTTLDPTNQILVVDTTLADPLQQQRRMMLRRALDWVTANPAGTATDTLATLGIGGTVYNFAGGGGTSDGVLTGGVGLWRHGDVYALDWRRRRRVWVFLCVQSDRRFRDHAHAWRWEQPHDRGQFPAVRPVRRGDRTHE